MTGAPRLSLGHTTALAAAATAVCVLPVHITGAVAVEMQEDLLFGVAGLGVALGAFRAVSAIATVPLGRLTDRFGARRTIRIAAAIAAFTSLGIALLASNWWWLVALLMVGGCANALGHPSSHRLLMVGVATQRRGLALGLKQAAPPISTILSGLSVPLVALTIGWRWAFVFAGVFAVLVVVAAPRPRPLAERPKRVVPKIRELGNGSSIVLVAVAFGLANAAAATVPAFYILASVEAGGSPEVSGVTLAVAGLLAMVSRLVSGLVCDRMETGHLRWCSLLVLSGAFGIALLATGDPPLMAIGVLLGLTAGWGFNVLLWYPLLTSYPQASGAVTGVVGRGGLLGGTIGPVVFGFIAENSGYGTAWLAMASLGVISAIAIRFASFRFRTVNPVTTET